MAPSEGEGAAREVSDTKKNAIVATPAARKTARKTSNVRRIRTLACYRRLDLRTSRCLLLLPGCAWRCAAACATMDKECPVRDKPEILSEGRFGLDRA
jgi:hypothetical protein